MWCSLVMFTGHLSTETYIIVARRIHSTLTTSNRALRHIKVPTRADWLRILNSIFRRVLILSGFTFDIRVTSAVWFSVQHANLCNVGGNVIRSGFRGQKTSEGEMPGGICPGGMSDSAFYGPTWPTPWVIRSNSTQDSTKNNFPEIKTVCKIRKELVRFLSHLVYIFIPFARLPESRPFVLIRSTDDVHRCPTACLMRTYTRQRGPIPQCPIIHHWGIGPRCVGW